MKFIENGKIYWTKHSRKKMRQYQLSENRVKRVLKNPERKETGIASGTIALMQTTGTKKYPKEIWLMYQIVKSKVKSQELKVISVWRYPGKSPIGKPPIPDDILEELNREYN